MPGLTSAAGLISLLDEPEEQLKCYALEKLNENVDQFWTEISEHLAKVYVRPDLLVQTSSTPPDNRCSVILHQLWSIEELSGSSIC